MKTLLSLTLVLTCTVGHTVMAQSSTETREGSCIQIMDACKAAGYNKNISKTCTQPLLNGQSVSGVNVPASVISDCKAKKSQLKAEK
ncbi:hypothetical protein [Pseudobdellovibrio exovorus]|uniref:Uncharacterized protein n=1 Tax=Pseudobdellovibrio exovorus JSS TaxID=1184267 RepID=M4V9E2_9BACT|nr:hypothetical protein [Pseudobdellovibrio exovorus]AGH95997.1 hypothetical protein A11Q_1781 [Pseudobdellovibrio exovorus JSS]